MRYWSLSRSAFLTDISFIFCSLTPKGRFLSQQHCSTVNGRAFILEGFYCEEEELPDRLTHAERESEGEREGEGATASVTVWLLGALYMLLTPGRAALQRSLLSCREISELIQDHNTEGKTFAVSAL